MSNANTIMSVKRNGLRVARSVALGVLVAAWAAPASAAVYRYVDWTAADPSAGTASGVITLPDTSTVTVNFAAKQPGGAADTLYGAQTSGGSNFWAPDDPYKSAEVENAPPDTDILQLFGGVGAVYTVTLSEPIKDPIMAIVSLGAPGTPTTYDFDSPFTIVSQGVGYWGGSSTALAQLPGDVLEGSEGHGTIRFTGTFSTFSWTVPTPEGWHGFTFGIRTTSRIEPEGGAGGAGGGGGADFGGAGGSVGGSDAGGTDAGGVGGDSAGSGASAGSGEGGAAGSTGGNGTAGHDSGAGNGGEGADSGIGGDGGVGATGGTGGTRGGSTGNGGALTGSGGRSSGGRSSGGSDFGGEGGDDSSGEEVVGCSCSVPGRGDSSLPLTSAVMALGALAFWRRGRRRRG